MSIDKGQVCILIPTLNEAPTIRDLIDDFRQLGFTNILVIDGNSADATRGALAMQSEDFAATLDTLGICKFLRKTFRDFYADTAMFGGGVHATRCGYEFFGADQVVFATDTPLGPIAPTIETVKKLRLAPAEERKLFCGNAERLLNITF